MTLPASGISSDGRFHAGMMIVERYRIAGLLGRGGMGEVYRAEVRVALAGRPVFDGLMKE